MKLGDWNVHLKRRHLRLLDPLYSTVLWNREERYVPGNLHFIGAGRAARLSQLESHRVGQLINSNIVMERRKRKGEKNTLDNIILLS